MSIPFVSNLFLRTKFLTRNLFSDIEELEPPDTKKTKDDDGRRFVHVDRQTRVDTFRSLGGQRFSIILAQA